MITEYVVRVDDTKRRAPARGLEHVLEWRDGITIVSKTVVPDPIVQTFRVTSPHNSGHLAPASVRRALTEEGWDVDTVEEVTS